MDIVFRIQPLIDRVCDVDDIVETVPLIHELKRLATLNKGEFIIEDGNPSKYIFRFENESDAIAFKLKYPW